MSETWLPNLVGGVSIWKLAVDLNEPKFFGGALLVPETEGSESLPATVRWDLTDLVPLAEARAKYPAETDAAIADFRGALDRVAKVFATPNSGFDKYKDAFTVPALDGDAAGTGANYFYSPAKKKLYVINWGASPRSMGGKAEYVFGYEDWNRAFKDKDVAKSSAPMLAAAAAGGAAAGAAAAAATAADAEKQKEDAKKKEPDKARPWWLWPLLALLAIAIVLLALLLLKSCEEQKNAMNADASADANADANASADANADANAEGDASADANAEAGTDAGADAGADAASADGGDAGKDGGLADADDVDPDDVETDDLPDGTPLDSSGTFTTKTGKPVVVQVMPGTTHGAKTGPHRRHYQKNAVKWRVASGTDRVSRTEQRGQRYDVWLAPGKTFEGVKVEWQDKAGKWHPH